MLACSFQFSYRDMVLGFMMKVDDLMFVRAIVSTVRGRRSGIKKAFVLHFLFGTLLALFLWASYIEVVYAAQFPLFLMTV